MVVPKVPVLPLVPENMFPEAWFEIIQSAPNTNEMRSFRQYFERTWYPKFNPSILSCANQRHRTTNTVEGWHKRLNAKIPKKISLMLFIYKLRKEAEFSNQKILKSEFELKAPKIVVNVMWCLIEDIIKN